MEEFSLISFKLFRSLAFSPLLLLFVACEVKEPLELNDTFPWIDTISIPDALYTTPDRDYVLNAMVKDPQGNQDIDWVEFTIFDLQNTVILEDKLVDDGQNGDVIQSDGVFSTNIRPSQFGVNSGEFVIRFQATDKDGHASEIYQSTILLIDGIENEAPVLQLSKVPQILDLNNYDNIKVMVSVLDPQGSDDLDTVFCDVYPPGSPVSYYRAILNDSGVEGDSAAADLIYTAVFDLSDELTDPPVIQNVVIPENLSRSLEEPILLSATVTDPQGLGDVKNVYFKAFKPDGTPASDQPFFSLYDDGDATNHGDEIANDGTYSLLIQISPENNKGSYRFEFYAEDFTELKGNSKFRFQAKDKSGTPSRAIVKTVPTDLGSGISDPVVRLVEVID